jgi:hypothetical protein
MPRGVVVLVCVCVLAGGCASARTASITDVRAELERTAHQAVPGLSEQPVTDETQPCVDMAKKDTGEKRISLVYHLVVPDRAVPELFDDFHDWLSTHDADDVSDARPAADVLSGILTIGDIVLNAEGTGPVQLALHSTCFTPA